MKRAVLSGGLVLGAVAAVVGALGGIAVAAVALPFVQGFSTEVLGPFEVSVRDVTLIALCGLLSAVLAAVVPAMLAARQDVVAVLAGRRGDTRAGLRSPVLGAVLLGRRVWRSPSSGPATTPAAGRCSSFSLPSAPSSAWCCSSLSWSLSSAASRTVCPCPHGSPSATRPGTGAARDPRSPQWRPPSRAWLPSGIGGASDAAERQATYTPSGPLGAAVVIDPTARPDDWEAMRAAVASRLPGARVTSVLGVRDAYMKSGDVRGPVESIDLRLVSSRPDENSGGSTKPDSSRSAPRTASVRVCWLARSPWTASAST